jgi:1-acyl-sn-glycerol-3-phosphate acyltransferase
VLSHIANFLLANAGWRVDRRVPASSRFVLIAAPHTSNWDLYYLLLMSWSLGLKVSWMGKHTLFRGPMGWVMRRLGGIPIERNRSANLVQQMADVFEKSRSLALTVPAEGTRAYVPHWKSGFYHIARTANVPIVPSYLDYSRKRGGLGPEIIATGNVRDDMDEIRAFYSGVKGKYPDRFGEILLKEEL